MSRSRTVRRLLSSGAVIAIVAGSLAVGGSASGANAAHARHHKKPAKPTVATVSPAHGPAAGGKVVTIRGKHFKGAKQVRFGTTKGKHLDVVSSKKLTVTTPEHSGGTVSVRVVTKAGTSKKSATYFFTKPAPTGMKWKAGGPLEQPAGNPTSVSCPSAAFCVAVDGRGSALTFDGTKWSRPTDVDDGYDLYSVSCTSATFCVAVGGGYDDAIQFQSTNTFVYNGTKWTANGELSGGVDQSVSCVSGTFCMFTEESLTGGDVWSTFNGTKWKAEKSIGNGTSLGVDGVSCTSTTFCMAVGSDTGDALSSESTFNGTAWSAVSTFGPASSYTSGVSCATDTSCTAIGGVYVGAGQASRWNGTTWTTHSFGDSAYLQGVSCASASTCQVVGSLSDSSDSTQAGWSAAFDTSSWTASNADLGGALTSVSCTSAGGCEAVGNFRQPSYVHSTDAGDRIVLHLDGYAVREVGGTWDEPASMDPSEGDGLTSISCPTPTFCATVDLGGTALTINNGVASAPASIAVDNAQFNNDVVFSAGPSSVSCGSPTFCVAVGTDIDTDFNDNFGFASVWDGSHWTKAADIDDGAALFDVSCVASGRCVAVGDTGQVVVYDNGAWSAPKTVDAGDYIDTISCTSATFCVAASQGGKAIITTDGDTWSTDTPFPGHALATVSCTSTTFCLAVSGDGHEVTYNGTSWSPPVSISTTDAPNNVSCVSASYCIATDAQTGNGFTYNGLSWSKPTVVDKLAYRGDSITGLDCVESKLCFGSDYFDYLLVGVG